MFKFLTFLVPVLRRVLHTNKFTSIGATVALVSVLLLLGGKITAEHMLAMLATAVTIIGYASKDGVRGDATVAREDVPQMPPLPPTATAVVLGLCLAGLLTACSGFLSRQAPAVAAQDAVSKSLLASQLSHHYEPTVRELVATPDSIDLPPALASVPEAPYLVAPPAHLSKRERRQFVRAQRRALREAARTVPAKVRLGKGAAYNAAPDGTAVAQKNIDAPVGLGPGAVATDNNKLGQHANGPAAAGHDFAGPLSGATTPPKLSFLGRIWAGICQYWPVGLAVVVIGALGALRFSAFGQSVRLAAFAARSAHGRPAA